MGDAIFFGQRGYLSGQIVTTGVQAGCSFAFFGFRTGGKLRVGAVGGKLFFRERFLIEEYVFTRFRSSTGKGKCGIPYAWR